MIDSFFNDVASLRERPKPRAAGLTMVIDWGLGPHLQDDLLETGAVCFDFAKIAVGLGRLLSRELLAKKITQYQAAGVEPFPGGQFLEYAHVHGTQDAYFDAVAAAGYRWCEVSDNLASVSIAWKQAMVRQAVNDFGLNVLGEVGRKEGVASRHSLADDAQACVDAGASIVLIEAAELIDEDARIVAEVEAVIERIGVEQVMFELPGPWIEGVHHCDIHAMRRSLLRRFGGQVNLGNVAPEDVLPTEALRQGLGVNAGGPGGDFEGTDKL